MKIFSKNEAVSLIIAIIFVSVLMLLSASLAEINLAAIKNRANKTLSDRTKDVANGALELAYNFADKKGVGHNATLEDAKKDAGFQKTWDEYMAFLKPLGIDCVDCAGFRIIGRSEKSPNGNYGLLKIGGIGSEYFSAPAAYKDENSVTVGTGNAAEKCEDPTGADADDACHWNRIYLNEAVEIPLYYVDDSGATQKLGDTDNFKLRVRAPCNDYKNGVTNCPANARIELYPPVAMKSDFNNPNNPFGNPQKDKVLLQWLINDPNSGESTLFANDFLGSNGKRPYPNSLQNVKDNTEISSGRINDAKNIDYMLQNFIVLEENQIGGDLDNNSKNDPTIGAFINSIEKPTLRLNLVGQPRKVPGDYLTNPDINLNDSTLFVPFLEWQILTNKPIADNKITLFGWATISDFYRKFKAEKYLPKTEGGFVLGNL